MSVFEEMKKCAAVSLLSTLKTLIHAQCKALCEVQVSIIFSIMNIISMPSADIIIIEVAWFRTPGCVEDLVDFDHEKNAEDRTLDLVKSLWFSVFLLFRGLIDIMGRGLLEVHTPGASFTCTQAAPLCSLHNLISVHVD